MGSLFSKVSRIFRGLLNNREVFPSVLVQLNEVIELDHQDGIVNLNDVVNQNSEVLPSNACSKELHSKLITFSVSNNNNQGLLQLAIGDQMPMVFLSWNEYFLQQDIPPQQILNEEEYRIFFNMVLQKCLFLVLCLDIIGSSLKGYGISFSDFRNGRIKNDFKAFIKTLKPQDVVYNNKNSIIKSFIRDIELHVENLSNFRNIITLVIASYNIGMADNFLVQFHYIQFCLNTFLQILGTLLPTILEVPFDLDSSTTIDYSHLFGQQ